MALTALGLSGDSVTNRSTPALVARVTELAETGRINQRIGDALNAEGFRPSKRTVGSSAGRSAP